MPRPMKCCGLSCLDLAFLLCSCSLLGISLCVFGIFSATFVVMAFRWPSGDIEQAEAFCAGTTAAYRKGNGSNSVLTPSITLRAPTHPPMRIVHPVCRTGFDACHGSDICDGTIWADVQADAEASGVYSAILLLLIMLLVFGNLVLMYIEHTAGLSIS